MSESNYNTKEVLRFVKLSANGYAPSKGSLEAAGYDLYRYLVNLTHLKANLFSIKNKCI